VLFTLKAHIYIIIIIILIIIIINNNNNNNNIYRIQKVSILRNKFLNLRLRSGFWNLYIIKYEIKVKVKVNSP